MTNIFGIDTFKKYVAILSILQPPSKQFQMVNILLISSNVK